MINSVAYEQLQLKLARDVACEREQEVSGDSLYASLNSFVCVSVCVCCAHASMHVTEWVCFTSFHLKTHFCGG